MRVWRRVGQFALMQANRDYYFDNHFLETRHPKLRAFVEWERKSRERFCGVWDTIESVLDEVVKNPKSKAATLLRQHVFDPIETVSLWYVSTYDSRRVL